MLDVSLVLINHWLFSEWFSAWLAVHRLRICILIIHVWDLGKYCDKRSKFDILSGQAWEFHSLKYHRSNFHQLTVHWSSFFTVAIKYIRRQISAIIQQKFGRYFYWTDPQTLITLRRFRKIESATNEPYQEFNCEHDIGVGGICQQRYVLSLAGAIWIFRADWTWHQLGTSESWMVV